MNERDSEAVAAQLVAKGYSMTADALTADVILLNTCSVRDAADQKAPGKMSHVAGQVPSNNRKAVRGRARAQARRTSWSKATLLLAFITPC